MYLHCSACENYINSMGYGVCHQCHRIGKIFTKCCNNYICRVPSNVRVKKPDYKWNIKCAKQSSKRSKEKRIKIKDCNKNQWRRSMESELFDVRHAFKQVSIKDMNKSSNKRYVKQHGNVKKTCNYLRNVFLSDDEEPVRCVRPGYRAPIYIIQDGRPLLLGNK